MWIGTIAPSDASAGTNVAKTGIIVGVGQEIGQGDAARLKACEAVGVAVENTVDMVQVAAGGTERGVEAARRGEQVVVPVAASVTSAVPVAAARVIIQVEVDPATRSGFTVRWSRTRLASLS